MCYVLKRRICRKFTVWFAVTVISFYAHHKAESALINFLFVAVMDLSISTLYTVNPQVMKYLGGNIKVEIVGTWNGTVSQVWKARRKGMSKIMDWVASELPLSAFTWRQYRKITL